MCELPLIAALLGSAAGLITVALVFLGAAIAANNGFFSAPGSPGLMAASGGFLLGALTVLTPAAAMVGDFVACMNASTACAGELSNFMNNLAALMTVLGIHAVASFAAAGIAWIPWAGQAPMWVIGGALLAQLALIPSLIAFFEALLRCVNSAALVGMLPLPLILLVGTVGVVTAASYVYLGRDKRPRASKDEPAHAR